MQSIRSYIGARWLRALLLLIIIVVISIVIHNKKNEVPNWVTGSIDSGTVSQIVSVSGTMNATKNAALSFPVGGILQSIVVHEGDQVTAGMELATLEYSALTADYQDAQASLYIAQANQKELIDGLRPEERDVARTKVSIANAELSRITKEYNDKVNNAHRTLLTTGLTARPVDTENDDTPPVVSGTYTCNEGDYTITVYPSSAKSGYSYRLSGLEEGTYTAYTDAAGIFGTCGLSIQFSPNVYYGNSQWTISIPNMQSSLYTTNHNAYTLAQTERTNAIHSAEQNLKLAQETEILGNANPRSESMTRSNAQVMQAEARLQKIDAQIRDRILIAPFDGTVSHIGPVIGEPIGTEPVLTLVSKDVFELTALIPEIDITKISIGQKAQVVFDARTSETLDATIMFVSPLARVINGVSYFETKLMLDTPTTWLQSGLNADVDIIIESHENVTRIPKRFLVTENNTSSVLMPDGNKTKRVPVTVVFSGNNGFIQVEGVQAGDILVAP